MPRGRFGYFGHHWGPCMHGYPGYGAPPWWRRPSPEDEKQALDEYIETLKQELQEAEAYRQELEGGPSG